jgi:hypothetical protein
MLKRHTISALKWTAALYVPFALLAWWIGNPHGPLSGSVKVIGFLLALPFWFAFGLFGHHSELAGVIAGLIAWFVCLFAVVFVVRVLVGSSDAKHLHPNI